MRKFMQQKVSSGVAVVVLLVVGCAEPAAPPSVHDPSGAPNASDIRSNLRTLDARWVAAVAGKDATKVADFYAEDGQFLEPGSPIASDKEAIRKEWAALLASASFVSLTFAPANIQVAEAGDIAYEVGAYELSTKDPQGKPTSEKGKYVVIWKKQADASWKVEVDIDNPGV